MKRVKSYNQFRDSRDSKVNEEFINKLWRKITGADEKEIVELSAKIKSEYDSYSESEKRILSNEIDNYIRKNDINSRYSSVKDEVDWYGTMIVLRSNSGTIGKAISNLKDILGIVQGESTKSKIGLERKKVTNQKRIDDLNEKVKNYRQILDNYDELMKFNENKRDPIALDFTSILKNIPGSPWPEGPNYFGGTSNFEVSFAKYHSVYIKDKEFVKTDAFSRLVAIFKKRDDIIAETGVLDLWKDIEAERLAFREDTDLMSQAPASVQEVPNYDYYKKTIKWAQESLAGKTVQEVLKSMMKEKMIVIKRNDVKEATEEDGKIVAGNIIYSGQNFNNLTLDRMSSFINKEGYKETASGKGMFATNNIPYAFYYCHYRFGIENTNVSETLFPTIYKITLKPGTEFFYKEDTHINQQELSLALICGASGFHSGNDIVNDQSVEISIFTPDCIESMVPIKSEDLIAYLDSPQLKEDNDRWISADRFKINSNVVAWYKSLVEANKK
jgi:hypothetical protein